jgi:hypothetical protein
MSGFGIGNLHLCQGHVTAQQYLQILQGPMMDSAYNRIKFPGQQFIFQEDNAPVHTAKLVKNWLASKPFVRLPWPAQSPDMSPIETLWNKMKLSLHNARPANKNELLEVIREQWNKYTMNDLRRLTDTMPRRVRDLYNARGGHTKW